MCKSCRGTYVWHQFFCQFPLELSQYQSDAMHVFDILDQVLSDHVIASYMTRSSGECFLYCAMNQECRSFNYEFASNPPGMLGIFVKSTMQH